MKNNTEIERKFIIALPDLKMLSRLEGYDKSEIEQTYLESPPHVTHRVRARRRANSVVFTETKKVRIDKMSAYEDEREIGVSEYRERLENIKDGTRTLYKTRHVFVYADHVIEIDVYPEWRETAVMEIELSSRDEKIELPAYIRVIREVTGMREYSNAAMSERFPDEIL